MVKKILNILSTTLLLLLIGIVIFVFVSRVSGESPSIFGYHFFRVSSGSMEPVLKVGDVILSKEVPVEEIHKGDIITYNGLEGDMEGKVITHEVVEEPYEENGHYFIQTQGKTKGALLDPIIRYEQVEGKYITTLGFMNAIYTFFLSPYGLIAFIFIIVALFGYEIISLILSYKSMDEIVYDDDYYEPKKKKKSKKRK